MMGHPSPRGPPVTAPIVTADSITRVGPEEAAGAVVVNASHGGVYAAYLAAKLGVAAAIFNDAGVGRDACRHRRARLPGQARRPGRAVGHRTARIGDGADMLARGVITHANALALALGCRPGMACREAAGRLAAGRSRRAREPPPALEGGVSAESASTPQVWALDSASLVVPEHKDAIVVTGSHGGSARRQARDGAQIRCARRPLQRCRDRHRRGRRVAPAGARRARHRRRHRRGRERPHRRRPLDLRGRHRCRGSTAAPPRSASRRHDRARVVAMLRASRMVIAGRPPQSSPAREGNADDPPAAERVGFAATSAPMTQGNP